MKTLTCLLKGCKKLLPTGRKKFCSNKHKDIYHNRKNPRGYYAHLHPDSKRRGNSLIPSVHDRNFDPEWGWSDGRDAYEHPLDLGDCGDHDRYK